MSGRPEPGRVPAAAEELIEALAAPPRLRAHLALVCQAAGELLAGVRTAWPGLAVDGEAVRFGAATHDLGKTLHPAELSGPGRLHERDGPALLERHGVAPELARFARTHGAWQTEPAALEDLLVALADACWKGARWPELESALGALIAGRLGADQWEVWLALDGLIESVADGADRRLAWHNQLPAASPAPGSGR